MKNIHILPTTQKSRLATNPILNPKRLGKLEVSEKNTFFVNGWGFTPQNIYITSAQEIKVGDWFINESNQIEKGIEYYDYKVLSPESKKIILTTDQDLINEGVQPIDDEFLEWFVKNPSCESVKVKKECCGQCDERLCEVNDLGRKETKENTFYKIIIPEEEPKQHLIDMMKSDEELGLYDEPKTKCYCGHTTYCDCGPEQDFKDIELPQQERPETLEEAAEWLYPIFDRFKYDEDWVEDVTKRRDDFIKGAKWQQERSYSEEDMKLSFETGRNFQLTGEDNFNELIEQFKKK
jgi:hypothetical protein